MSTMQNRGTEPVLTDGLSVFPRITWIRDVEQDPRITSGLLDLAKVMGTGADRHGRCNLTIRQIQQRLVLRQPDGDFIPERTIKSWRTKLKKFGVMSDIAPGVGAGFAGPGQGRGGTWQLVGNGQSKPLETGNETGNSIAHSTITPTKVRDTPQPKAGDSKSIEVEGNGSSPLGGLTLPLSGVRAGSKSTPPSPTETDRVTEYSAASEDYRAGDDFPSASDWFSAEPPKVALGIPCRPNSRTTYA